MYWGKTLTVSELETDREFQTNRGVEIEDQLPESVPFHRRPLGEVGVR